MSNSIYNSRIEEITNGVHMILKNQSLVVGKAFESYKKKKFKTKGLESGNCYLQVLFSPSQSI